MQSNQITYQPKVASMGHFIWFQCRI